MNFGVLGKWHLPKTQCNGAWPDMIKFYSAQEVGFEFELTWELSIGGNWLPGGTTKHTAYLGAWDPVTPEGRKTYQETLWNIACRNADSLGGGAPSLTALADAVYAEFADREVARVKPTQGILRNEAMTYWKERDENKICNSPKAMLESEDGDGNCVAWAFALIDALHLVGIDAKWIEIRALAPDVEFIVKNPWKDHSAAQHDPPYVWEAITSIDNFDPSGDPLGIPGQGGEAETPFDPWKTFLNHHIARVENTWYDPSYGTPKLEHADGAMRAKTYEDTYIDVYGTDSEVDVPGFPVPVILRLYRENNPNGPAEISILESPRLPNQ